MKCYIAKFYKKYNYGAFDESAYVIFANDDGMALSIALEQEPTSSNKDWELEEVNPTEIGASFVYERNN